MRSRLFSLFALAALLIVAGCERSDVSPFTIEGDEPGYRRGKDLIKQGRNQEALSEFQKVIDKRGLNNAAESHLEVGLLYQYHIKDPISAIYHYRKYRELKPNSQQADLVRQRIDAATRDFARSLLVQTDSLDKLDSDDLAKRLQRENDKLKADLAAARANRPVPVAAADEETPAAEPAPVAAPNRGAYAITDNSSPVVRAAVDIEPEPTPEPVAQPRPPVAQPARPTASTTVTRPSATTTRPTTTTTRPTTGSYRRHTISKGDTLYSLAQKYYGNRSRWRDIYAANRDVMKSEGDLRIGMEVKIPQ
ncbi:MAG: LysM peptidoglycan-binding domain-containing protein [Verrucomicrobia bacterium]|nr:LysM peptidoglycan-binding domain-containing protein [Verrucomicrobiota bacterium]